MLIQRFKILLVTIMFFGVSTAVWANLPTPPTDSINVHITLNWNSSVNLMRNQKGQYAGKLYLSTKQTTDKGTYATSQSIAADTVANLLQKMLDLGLLDLKSSELKVIDGFKTNITITKPNDERKVSLVTGVYHNENSKKAGNIINFLSTELNVQHRLFSYLNTLPAGHYTLGMTSIKVHALMPVDGKKEFFVFVIRRII